MSRCSTPQGAALADWRATGGAGARATRQVLGAAPFVAAQALVARGDDMRGAHACAASRRPRRPASRRWPRSCSDSTLRQARAGRAGTSCSASSSRARSACARATRSRVVAPGGQVTPAGIVPRLKQFTRGRHLRGRALRVRQRAGADPPRRRGAAASRRGADRRAVEARRLHQAARAVAAQLAPGAADQHQRARLDAHQPQLVRRGAAREAPDVHHPDADRRGGRVQPRLARW